MQDIIIDKNLAYIFLIVAAVLLVAQAFVLLRIRNILHAIAMNFDSALTAWRKFAAQSSAGKDESPIPKTCQFCRHRLAYINTSKTKNDEEDFYHRCDVRKVNIALDDSCQHFERDGDLF